ncbi:predicted membrane protein [Longilinea arvoryzae]|uniref:Predicted membrane protein n=1 Tax=Longilinea arvoryzae TaxID=360412 RepID=A0A0S7BL72_9CHLR|nr:DUF389 domain-containing protein [Longilinea arvoryzae]GAP15379.1 predicted membrane protein [Longilinea arvoryzae]
MNLPSIEPILPEDPDSMPPARRRRSRRLNFSGSSHDERAAFLAEVAHRVTPSADFYLFTLLSGAALVAALLLDSPALFVLSALIAPFLAPVMGLAFGTLLGSPRFFLESLAAVFFGGLIVFGMGALAGWIAQYLPVLTSAQASLHAVFTWTDFLLLTLGAGLTTFLLVRSPDVKPLVSNVALTYALYLPAGVAGFGLISGAPGLWPNGLIVFAVHLAWAVLVGAIVLAALHLRPLNFFGYTVVTGLALICILAAVALLGLGTVFQPLTPSEPTQPPVTGVTATSSLAPTDTVSPRMVTTTPTHTLVPSGTPTRTLTPIPTPLWAKVYAPESNGVLVRLEPDGTSKIVYTLLNDSLVEILPETVQDGSVTWVHVRVNSETLGWINQSLLITATPAPSW